MTDEELVVRLRRAGPPCDQIAKQAANAIERQLRRAAEFKSERDALRADLLRAQAETFRAIDEAAALRGH